MVEHLKLKTFLIKVEVVLETSEVVVEVDLVEMTTLVVEETSVVEVLDYILLIPINNVSL